MALEYRHRPLGTTWPGTRTVRPKRSAFKADWGRTLRIIESEIRKLGGRAVVLAVQVDERGIRLDGGIRSDARIRDPGVILEFKVGPDLLQFPCDTFNFWQDNVRAIGLALEALRAVNRYGVRQGRQYEGFKKLPGPGGSTITMGAAEAAAVIVTAAADGLNPEDLLRDRALATVAVRVATAKTHPDRHAGDAKVFMRVQDAKCALTAHHGGTL